MRLLSALLLSSACAFAVEGGGRIIPSGSSSGDDPWNGAGDPVSFGELDGDHDGKVSQAEWKEGRAQLERAIKETRAAALEANDRDHNGKLSRYEAVEAKPRFTSLMTQARLLALAQSDADHDGKLNRTEADALIERCGPLLAAKGARVGQKDRVITETNVADALTAVVNGSRTVFSLCDVNNDGQLSQQEIGLAFDLLRAVAGD
jgi:Ca2+-binding EF-hand superfamily protein